MRRPAATLAVFTLALSACLPSVDDAGTIEIPTSEGGSAQLRIVDQSGFLVSARGARDAGAVDDFELQAVPDASNTIRVVWFAAPCENRPHLTISGNSLDALELVLDRGPVPEDALCPSIGAAHGVDLVFNGDISVDEVDADMIGP